VEGLYGKGENWHAGLVVCLISLSHLHGWGTKPLNSKLYKMAPLNYKLNKTLDINAPIGHTQYTFHNAYKICRISVNEVVVVLWNPKANDFCQEFKI